MRNIPTCREAGARLRLRRAGRGALARAATLLLVLLAAPAGAAGKDKAKKSGDLLWVHPEYDSARVQSIAMLPAASFDHNRQNERLIEGLLAQALRPSGYRWITPQVARELIRSGLGDTTLAAIDGQILAAGRVDSVRARQICRALRAQAILGVRLEQFEKTEVEWNQSGKPSTSVRVRATVVDSTGRLLWDVAGSETGDGPHHDPQAATLGIRANVGNTPMTGQGGAPSFQDVATRLFTRWMQSFPPRRAPEPAQP